MRGGYGAFHGDPTGLLTELRTVPRPDVSVGVIYIQGPKGVSPHDAASNVS